MNAVTEAAPEVGTRYACDGLGVARASYYRKLARAAGGTEGAGRSTRRPAPPRTLDEDEKSAVLTILHSERFVDMAPSSVYATLLDEGEYCKILLKMGTRSRPDPIENGDRCRGRFRQDYIVMQPPRCRC